VYEAEWNHTKVAVKVSNAVTGIDDFRREAQLVMYVSSFCTLVQCNLCRLSFFCLTFCLYSNIKPHPNVLRVFGVSLGCF
jgi:hypothetical protein